MSGREEIPSWVAHKRRELELHNPGEADRLFREALDGMGYALSMVLNRLEAGASAHEILDHVRELSRAVDQALAEVPR